jgi:membrane protein YqaA with SNARE-associated domain
MGAVSGQGLRRAAIFVRGPRISPTMHRRHVALATFGVVTLVVLNAAVYFAPVNYAAFASFAYAGAFLVCFFANAVVAIPIPYIPVVAQIGASAGNPALVVVLGALGSVLGESIAFFVGRAEEGLVSEHPIYRRVHRMAERPFVAGLLLFALAAPLNPLFDVAGLAAGAVGLQYRVFFVSVLLGRLARLAIIVWLGTLFAPRIATFIGAS